MRLIAIDPGSDRSAYVVYEDGKILAHGMDDNDVLLGALPHRRIEIDRAVIEMIASYGMPVGAEVFETCVWIGRFMEAVESASIPVDRIFRRTIKMHLCQSARAKDSNVRRAIIDRMGPPGTKKSPGATYGISKDVWAALAVAITYADQNPQAITETRT